MMRRMAAPLAVALLTLAGTGTARANLGGLGGVPVGSTPVCGDPQVNFSECQTHTRASYRLVYDSVIEKRFHVCYETVSDTVMKPVCRTLYRDDIQTCYRTVRDVEYRNVQETVTRPVYTTVMKSVPYTYTRPVYETNMKTVTETVCRPVTETHYKTCNYTVYRQVQETHFKECPYTVCKPVYENHTRTDHFQICKTVCETHMREVCQTVCKPVCETRYRTECYTTCRPVFETINKTICCTGYNDVTETVMTTKVRYVCEPVTVYKTVTHRIPEYHCETYCVPGAVRLVSVPKYVTCFDPCTCQTVTKPCGTKLCLTRGEPEIRTRQVCTYRTVCQQVACTEYRRKAVCEQVPVTICKKVPYSYTKVVPTTVCRYVKETHTRQVPYTFTRIVHETIRKQVPYTTVRTVRGCYCDAASCGTPVGPNGIVTGCPHANSLQGFDCDGPGRVFVEGGVCTRTTNYTTVRYVKETHTRQVPYTVCRTIPEVHTKQVPYTVTRMVPTTVEKLVPVTTCRLVQECGVKQVPTTVCNMTTEVVNKCVPVCVSKQVPYTVCRKVPYTVTEMVPTTVCRKVPVTKEYDVCVRKPRWVCVIEPCPAPAPVCCDPCGPIVGKNLIGGCGTPCGFTKGSLFHGGLLKSGCGIQGNVCSPCAQPVEVCPKPACVVNPCCDPCAKKGLFGGFFRRLFHKE